VARDIQGKNAGFYAPVKVQIAIDKTAPNPYQATLYIRLGGVWHRATAYGADRLEAMEAALPVLWARTRVDIMELRALFDLPEFPL
jgi:hypothetical protein